MTKYFLGLDFANVQHANAKCLLKDEAGEITLCPNSDVPTREREIARFALDAPFGLTKPMLELLQGTNYEGDADRLRLRETDRRVGALVKKMRIADRKQTKLGGHPLFNSGSHIHPPMAFQTLPNALREVLRLERFSSPDSQTSSLLVESRLGLGRVVEAHPRLFLYSLLERLGGKYKTTTEEGRILASARDYGPAVRRKTEAGEEFEARRKQRCPNRKQLVKEICESSSSWMGAAHREFSGDFSRVAETDHVFDAFLCALTAFMHHAGETLLWSDLKIDRSTVEIEGHMIILRAASSSVGRGCQ